MNILQEIIDYKTNVEIPRLKKEIKKECIIESSRNFKASLNSNNLALIAEIKYSSPSQFSKYNELKPIRENFNVNDCLFPYREHASAISVVTDNQFFGGYVDWLPHVQALTIHQKIPVLRKDFIINKLQIDQSREYGADAILLIASILTPKQIIQFYDKAKEYNMDCLVEVHSLDELKMVLNETPADIIGINNRNLNTNKIDINNTLKLAEHIPDNIIKVSESGFNTKNQINKINNIVDGVLIGTSIIKSKDIERKINYLGF
ncbi:indole-3-glycerol phosphate synthase TrpC [Nanoarchaeota archaeon]